MAMVGDTLLPRMITFQLTGGSNVNNGLLLLCCLLFGKTRLAATGSAKD